MRKVPERTYSNSPLNRQFLTSAFDGIPYGDYFDDISGRYSIDMIRIKFEYNTKFYDFNSNKTKTSLETLCYFLDEYRENTDIRWSYCDYFKIGKYSSTATMTFRNDSTASFMVGRYVFEGQKRIASEIVAEFNPNKVPFGELKRILFGLSVNAVKAPKVIRFDLAIDIPVERSSAQIQFVGRSGYRMIRNSASDITEYLGRRHSHGAVKLYNKCKELGLEQNMTRLEITLEADTFTSVSKHIPDVYIDSNLQIGMEFCNRSFGVQACILHPDLIPVLKQSVSPNTWKKYKSEIDGFSSFKFTPGDVPGIDRFVRDQLRKLSEPRQWLDIG